MKKGRKVNRAKSKVIIMDRAKNNQPNTTEIVGYEVINEFNHLRVLVTKI